jgi:cold shock CspA family protein
MPHLTLLGQVMFFNTKRGFGRIRSDELPEGVFVHFSAIEDGSRVLVPHELVRFSYRKSSRGLRATHVQRLSRRLDGQVLSFKGGKGKVLSQPGGRRFALHIEDLLPESVAQVRAGVALEFSPFEAQAKEAVVVDPRPPLQRFAHLSGWEAHLNRLAELARPEPWRYPGSTLRGSLPVLRAYLHHTFARLKQENKIEQGRDQQKNPIAAFNTGLLSRDGQEILALCALNRSPYDQKSYLPRPRWQLAGFVPEAHPQVQHLEHAPSRAYYFDAPEDLIYDPTLPVDSNWEALLSDAAEALTATRQLREALIRSIRLANYDYQQAIPASYQGSVALLLPLNLSPQTRPSLAAVLERHPHRYIVLELLTLAEAYPLARLIAPVRPGWLHPASKKLVF